MQLTWQISPDVSIWYALAVRAAGRALVDERLAEEIDALLRPVAPQRSVSPIPADFDRRGDFWRRRCLETVADSTSLPGRSTSAPSRSVDGDSDASQPRSGEAELLSAARGLFARHLPRLASELPLRVRPFLELWEARGPGLLRQILRQAGQEGANLECLVAWVHPVCGGGGWSDAETRTVLFEAVLVNPVAPLPEVLRLAWLVVQTVLTDRRAAGSITYQGDQLSASLALVPAVLAAGEHVELTVCNARLIAAALHAWLEIPEPRAAELGAALAAWWEETA